MNPFKYLKFNNLFHLAICAFGIQFATALQMANMTSFYKFLGASNSHVSYLWLAAPISGLLIQPLVGQISDSTETRFGKRIPYIFFWGILASISLFSMAFATQVFIAAILLWILDCSINGCTEMLRSLTGDTVSNPVKPKAFSLQTVSAGCGAGLAACLPWLLENKFHLGMTWSGNYAVPLSIKIAFIVGGIVLALCVIYLMAMIREKPFRHKKLLTMKKQGLKRKKTDPVFIYFKELIYNLRHTPKIIRQFYIIQIFTWTGLFAMWLYFALAISQHYFGYPLHSVTAGNLEASKLLQRGTEWADLCVGAYMFVSVIYAMFLPRLVEKTSAKFIHGVSLILGGLSIAAIGVFPYYQYILLSMIGIGVMWGSIMSMPYAIVSAELPKTKMGVYLGIFNITITLPQILSGLFLGFITTKLFNGHAIYTLTTAGVCILIGGLLMLRQSYLYPSRSVIKTRTRIQSLITRSLPR